MPWKLRQVSGWDEYLDVLGRDGAAATIGMWFYHRHQGTERGATENGQQVAVILPPGGPDGVFLPYHDYPSGARWQVSGVWPLVTLTPSIQFPGRYHGYIQHGVITDDVDGRKF